ncbi:hypothetical protein [Epilithonimonas hominis]|uniref:hypothetical protein n=1 Tax=Epilithonimonas hominis TaxID=420404 RepID=UPI0028A70E05|nr:hypothetical protein [Epilithonimonas hominis]
MEKYLFEIHALMGDFRNRFNENFDRFLNSRFFWIFNLFFIPAYFTYQNIILYTEIKIVFYFYVFFTILVLLLLIPPVYYQVKGKDFFALKKKYLKTTYKNEPTETVKNISQDISKVIDVEKLDLLYSVVLENNLLDSSLINPEKINSLDFDCFSKSYFTKAFQSLSRTKSCDNLIYLTCDQKVAGYIIHELFRPILGIETKNLCNYFYYYKNDEFRKVNYQSINAISKRKEIKKIQAKISEILR